jgi:dTDP-3-amino-3,4,6-trideoxy-alpha-D-glucose transaminase
MVALVRQPQPMRIPVVNLRPMLARAEVRSQQLLAELFARGQFILGPQLAAFESEFAAAMHGCEAVGVGNGTDAIALSLRFHDVQRPAQQVLTTALTAPFTGTAVLCAGATPVFADIDPETLSIDTDDALNRLNRKTAALLPVHLYGQPADIRPLAAESRRRNIALVQDACQAHGASPFGQALTKFSECTAYSFYPTKNLGCLGDGGAIVTRGKAAARRLRMLRDGGRIATGPHLGQYSYIAGINSRLDEMQAVYLRAFLPHLSWANEQRTHLAAAYDERLSTIPALRPVKRHACSVHHLYVVRARRRTALRQHLAAQGIGSGIHYPVPLHLHPAFSAAGQKKGSLPHAEKAAREILSLPLWPGMSVEQVDAVTDAIRKFYR